MTGSILELESAFFTARLLGEIALAILLTAVAYLLCRQYPQLFRRVVECFRASTGHATAYILAAMFLPLALRLALLPWIPPPEPRIHDEFGHLLVADTLIAGRLANPPHPLWRHLETIYVLQQPTYSSIYPLGPGITLAAGKALTGNPWAGVLLTVALMCGAISWMLFGCLPASWAAVGGLLAAFDYGLQWVDSYWGGSFCAFGGALLLGAFCRLRERPSKVMGFIAGLGWSIVWLTRPYESLLLFMFAVVFTGALIIRDCRWRRWLGSFVLALAAPLAAVFLTALHNHAVTGSFTTLPYKLSQQVYGVPQSLLWQPAIKEPVFRFTESKEMYWWQRNAKDQVNDEPFRLQIPIILTRVWSFFVTPWYSAPIALLLLLLKDRDVLVCIGMLVCALAAAVFYPFFFPHYFAAYSCLIIFLITRGMMRLSQWSFQSKTAGRVIVLFLMLGGSMLGLRIIPIRSIVGRGGMQQQVNLRKQLSDRLLGLKGGHVVFVRYGANHSFHDEWVYNAAAVDASRIVWCRTMGPTEDAEVTRYYKDRQSWLVDVDRDTALVSSYQPQAD